MRVPAPQDSSLIKGDVTMSMQSALNTPTITADHPKGQRAVETFRAAYNKARLDDEAAQTLNEHGGFAAYLAEGIRKFSTRGPVFPIYLECEVGGKSKDELLAEIKSDGMFASDWANDILSQDVWRPGEKETVKFARAKIRDLGFTKNPKTSEIWARIRELGHALCEPGDGPSIRLALTDQPRGDYFWCAMEQITDSDGDPSVFSVERNDDCEQWLDAPRASPDGGWSLGDGVVFRLRKVSA
jgi:hypothetical protein